MRVFDVEKLGRAEVGIGMNPRDELWGFSGPGWVVSLVLNLGLTWLQGPYSQMPYGPNETHSHGELAFSIP